MIVERWTHTSHMYQCKNKLYVRAVINVFASFWATYLRLPVTLHLKKSFLPHFRSLPSLNPMLHQISFPRATESHSHVSLSLIPTCHWVLFPCATESHSHVPLSLIPTCHWVSFPCATESHSHVPLSLIPTCHWVSFPRATESHSHVPLSLIPMLHQISFPRATKSHSHAPPSLIPMSSPDCWCGGTACDPEGAHCSPFSPVSPGNRGHSRHGGWLEETIWPHATTFRYIFLSNYTHTTLPCNIENTLRVPIGQCS